MEIDETDGNGEHMYQLQKLMKYRKYYSRREINETNLVQNIGEEFILLS